MCGVIKMQNLNVCPCCTFLLSNCGNLNFSWRNDCNQCKAPKPEDAGGVSPMERGKTPAALSLMLLNVAVDSLASQPRRDRHIFPQCKRSKVYNLSPNCAFVCQEVMEEASAEGGSTGVASGAEAASAGAEEEASAEDTGLERWTQG